MLDKTVQYTFVNWNISWIKFLKFTKWELIAFSIPKKMFNNDLFKINYLKDFIHNSWVYFLLWDEIYIGQAIDLFKRVEWHIREWKKEFKNIILFTTTNNSFDEWDINFLEKNIIKIAKNVWNDNLTNITNWNKTNIKEFRKSDILWYIEEIKFLLYVLWYDFMESKVKEEDLKENINLYFLNEKWVNAKIIYNENWYVVLKWSIWRNKENPSLIKNYWNLINELLKKKIIEIRDNKLVFLKDYAFSSSSAPASILLWSPASWPREWKNKEWKTLNEIERKNLKK